jgi:ATP-dependent Clp protease ATP-binding subunit ClpA
MGTDRRRDRRVKTVSPREVRRAGRSTVRWPWPRGGVAGDDLRTLLGNASDEALRRGERRLGTDHVLLALLHEPESPAARAIGVTLAEARSAADRLDAEALAAIGVTVGIDDAAVLRQKARRFPPLTSGTREVLKLAIDAADPRRSGHIDGEYFLRALMSRRRPDPAAELMHALGVDRGSVVARLDATIQEDPR